MKLKKSFIYSFGILSLACLACAQDAPKSPPSEGGRPGGRPQGAPTGGDADARLAEFIKRVDTDGDGKISKEEFANLGKKENEERFARMDENKDGLVDKKEAGDMAQKMRRMAEGQRPGMQRPEGGSPGEGGGFRRPPGGEGDRPEGSRHMGGMFGDPKENFKRMDADGNGSVSEDEYIKSAEKMREMFRNRGGQSGGMRRPEGGAPGREGGFRRPPTEGDAPKAPEGGKSKDAA